MVSVRKHGIILEPTQLKFENQAVLNPGCIKKGNKVHMFYRAVRKGNYSTIGYCKLDGPLDVVERAKKPILKPEFDYEDHGVEDPRIVFLEGKYYMTYMGYDGRDVVAAYAVSDDLKKFEKKGIIVPLISYADAMKILDLRTNLGKKCKACWKIYNKAKNATKENVYIWGKDVVLFPKKIKGKYAMFHRILPDMPLIYFKDFNELSSVEYWKKHIENLNKNIVLDAKYWFETRQIGAGCPPIETDRGWLIIYHAVELAKKGNIYRAGAALVDKDDPCKIIGRLDYPLISPEAPWERKGDVNNVVFPSGAAKFDGRLYIYYGAADKRIAAASVDLEELLDELTGKE